MNSLRGKVAVITGGSDGLALASAKAFVAEGAFVFVTGRDRAKLDRALAEIGSDNAEAIHAAQRLLLRRSSAREKDELVSSKIRVNVLSPGPIDTSALAQAPQEMRDAYAQSNPMKRLGNSDEIGTAALFLASSASSFVTGTELCVDGGMAQF